MLSRLRLIEFVVGEAGRLLGIGHVVNFIRGVANTLILEHNSSILLFDDFLKVLGCLSIGVLRQSFHNLDLSFISKILPSFREIILTLQVF